MIDLDENFWSSRYENGYTGWDLGYASPPLYQYLCQIEKKDSVILVPGGGNAYEVVAAFAIGLKKVHLLDISKVPIARFLEKNPSFPKSQVHHENFFEHSGQYDLILEQTFFCALDPALRVDYAAKMAELLKPGGKLVGVLFDRDFEGGPPFGGSAEEYRELFKPYFHFEKFEPCHNSVPPRMGSELFMILKKSNL
ncbi:SAM-dependent methyltransferase [Algoriphagus sp. AK58]|uniref:SAM-dependent methyltransferase n=1 Tax=Algoriphagus sp. AK58 TaxID=1406877 RepID=UPI001650AC2D|nr:SAM-dependent methyltransferase [Algoriphagus sp. AK58]MBC6368732.1 SAM-dependent methyltransferase [Algoriphagus sp. AK58]